MANYAGRVSERVLPVDSFLLDFDWTEKEAEQFQSEDEMAAIAKAWAEGQKK